MHRDFLLDASTIPSTHTSTSQDGCSTDPGSRDGESTNKGRTPSCKEGTFRCTRGDRVIWMELKKPSMEVEERDYDNHT